MKSSVPNCPFGCMSLNFHQPIQLCGRRQVLLHAYRLRGAFPGGPPLLACSLTDTQSSRHFCCTATNTFQRAAVRLEAAGFCFAVLGFSAATGLFCWCLRIYCRTCSRHSGTQISQCLSSPGSDQNPIPLRGESSESSESIWGNQGKPLGR